MSERKPRAKKAAGETPPSVPLEENPVLLLLKKLAGAAAAQKDREDEGHAHQMDATQFCQAVTETLRKGEGCPCDENMTKIDRVHNECQMPNCRVSLVKALARIQCAEQVATAVAAASERPSDEVMNHVTFHLAEAGRLYSNYWQALSKAETGGKVH